MPELTYNTEFQLTKSHVLAVRFRVSHLSNSNRALVLLLFIHRNAIIRDNSAPIYRVTTALYYNGEKLIGLACSGCT